jgi:hypothetical protein
VPCSPRSKASFAEVLCSPATRRGEGVSLGAPSLRLPAWRLSLGQAGRLSQSILAMLLITLIVASGLNIAADLAAIGSGVLLLHVGRPGYGR